MTKKLNNNSVLTCCSLLSKRLLLVFSILLFVFKISNAANVYAPVKVGKSATNKIYVHLMPWFESKEFSGYWGQHWTMANQNPDIVDGSGRRQIASYYYPLIGPYASGDPDLVEYQLLLMKLAGVDGVLIDWPGTTNAYDYARNKQNSEAVIAMIDKVGLQFAIVYEDNNLGLANVADKIGQAKNDMIYARDNYFSKSSYIKINNAPLLLDFGPQVLKGEAIWTSVFSVLPTKPTFLTLWYQHDDAGSNCKGEYAWLYSDYLTGLDNFYANRPNYGVKMGVAYPGFNAFYSAGGWGSNYFNIPVGTGTFQTTLDKAFQYNSPYIQLATWNDFGEGTMIEPTRELGYSCLTYLQQKIGVSYRQPELELVYNLYLQRKQYKGNAAQQDRLTQVFYYLVSLQLTAARDLLYGTTPVTQSPYAGSAIAIPGTIEAENFDKGGENVAYHDVETANQGGQYRTSEGVDIEVCSEGGYNVGWTAAGEWMEYTINVTTTGNYNIDCRVASAVGGSFSIAVNNVDKTGTINVPNTGAWQTWQTVSKTGVSLNSGTQILRINSNGGFNINKITIVSASTNVPVSGVTLSPTTVSLATGATQQLAATVAPGNASNKAVSYATSNAAVANISAGGLITAVAAGSATITVTTQDGAKKATCAVTVTAGSVTKYRIKNRWQNTYLYDAGDRVRYAASVTNTTFNWVMESVGNGQYELKNVSTGDYMHIENLTGYIQCTARTSGWASSRWASEDAGSGYIRIKNAWQPTFYIHVENLQSQAQYGTINSAWYSAQWLLEPVTGSYSAPVSVENMQLMPSVIIYPNPITNGTVNIQIAGTESAEASQYTIFDLSGKIILKGAFDNSASGSADYSLNVSSFRKGLYIINIMGSNINTTTKLSIQ